MKPAQPVSFPNSWWVPRAGPGTGDARSKVRVRARTIRSDPVYPCSQQPHMQGRMPAARVHISNFQSMRLQVFVAMAI